MARGPHRAEGKRRFAAQHRVHRGDAGAGGAQRGFGRIDGKRRVFVKAALALEGGVEYVGHQGRAVHAQQGVARRARRVAPGVHGERGTHGMQHGFQPGGTLRVTGARIVRQASGMGVEQHA